MGIVYSCRIIGAGYDRRQWLTTSQIALKAGSPHLLRICISMHEHEAIWLFGHAARTRINDLTQRVRDAVLLDIKLIVHSNHTSDELC